MDQSEFCKSVQSGLGRAVLYVLGSDASEFRDVILDACLHCYSVDPQGEGTRAPYMVELTQATQDFEFYREHVLNALSPCGDDWHTVQRFRFAANLAMGGDGRARQAMYDSFNPGSNIAEEIGIDFLRMDGLEGFLSAATKLGGLIDTNCLFSLAAETFGEETILTLLRKAGKDDERVEAYRLAAEKSVEKDRADSLNWQEEQNRLTALHYDELRPQLAETSLFRLSKWGEQASEEDLLSAARDLRNVADPEDQLRLLRVFRRRAFPLEPDVLLHLARTENTGVALASASSLAEISHPSVREFAFRLVETLADGRRAAIAMLAQNRKPGDHDIVLSWFEREQDREVGHMLGIDLRRFWERHPDPATEVRMLLSVYENGPCSECREFLVRRLLELNALPDHIRAECAYDSNFRIRDLMAG